MADCLSIKRFDHLEFYVGNARQAARFYEHSFGFKSAAYRGLATGSREVTSYVVQQGDIRFVLSSALQPMHPISQSVQRHGDAVAIVALEVADVTTAYTSAIARGAISAIAPQSESDADGTFRYAAIQIYGDVLIKFIDRADYTGVFAPNYQPNYSVIATAHPNLWSIDHIVGNVESGKMDHWVEYFAKVLGFNLLVHFDNEAISTEYSALMSKVIQNQTGSIKFPINEPVIGKRKSQIQEYLDYHQGAGVQHVALTTNNIIETVRTLRSTGVEFLPVPQAYYDQLPDRIGAIAYPIEPLAELGILVDRDAEGYLLQIFTQPLQDRPTLFFEIIERRGCRGFGEGNFKSLFAAIEREQALRGNL